MFRVSWTLIVMVILVGCTTAPTQTTPSVEVATNPPRRRADRAFASEWIDTGKSHN